MLVKVLGQRQSNRCCVPDQISILRLDRHAMAAGCIRFLDNSVVADWTALVAWSNQRRGFSQTGHGVVEYILLIHFF